MDRPPIFAAETALLRFKKQVPFKCKNKLSEVQRERNIF
jgi:hypothetical protein